MSRKRIFYVAFFILLFIGFVAIMSFLIPGFTKKSIPPIGEVKPFSFVNQDGETINESVFTNKVVAVEYFFTTCKGICPRMNNNLKKVYEDYKDEKDFLILSHTCDPATDSAAQLKKYADSMGVDTDRWMFLTGRKDSLYYMARFAYMIDDPANNLQDINDDFLHTQFIALVNKQGKVVKIYDALKQSELKEMQKEIRKLLN